METIKKYRKKFVVLIVSAEITVLAFFCMRGEFIHAFLIGSALMKEILHVA